MSLDSSAVIELGPSPDEACNSGVSVLDSYRAVVEIVGEEVVERAFAKLPPELAAEYRGVLAVSWIASHKVEAVYRAIAAEAGVAVESLQSESVRRGVERTVRGAWKMLLRITTDDALIKRTPLLYGRAFNVGTLEAKTMEGGHAVLSLTGHPGISDFSLIGLAAGIEAVLRSAGRKDATVAFTRTPEGAKLEARWRR